MVDVDKKKSKKRGKQVTPDASNESTDETVQPSVLNAVKDAAVEWELAGMEFDETEKSELMEKEFGHLDEVLSPAAKLEAENALTEEEVEAVTMPNLDVESGVELEGSVLNESEDFTETSISEELSALSALESGDSERNQAGEEGRAEAEQNIQFVEDDSLVSILESILFSSDRPVSVATIKQVFKGTNIRTKDITRGLEKLAGQYASSVRGVTLEEINGGYQLRTKVDNAEFLRRLAKVRPFRLSGPALEVLAILAYKQPVTKHEVDEIRGVESGHLVRALMERGLVNFQGKSELPGKPMYYGTTRKFLEIFGLRNLKELPTLAEIDELIPEGLGDPEEKKEVLSDVTANMSQQIASSGYSEGEEELGQITDQLLQIDTSSEFFEQEKVRQREKRDRDRAQDLREAIAVGEAVEDKDRKWLARYEAKLAADLLAEAKGDEAEAGPMAEISSGTDSVSEEISTSEINQSLAQTSESDDILIASEPASSLADALERLRAQNENEVEDNDGEGDDAGDDAGDDLSASVKVDDSEDERFEDEDDEEMVSLKPYDSDNESDLANEDFDPESEV